MGPDQLLDEFLGLFSKLAQPGMLGGRNGDGLTDYRTALASLFLRGNQSLQAVKLLRASHLVADARTILRTLFEAAVTAKYLGTSPQELGTKFIIQSWIDQRRWFHNLVGPASIPPGEATKIQNAYNKGQQWYVSRGETLRKKWVGVCEMAEKTHLHKEYRAFYPRLSATAHPSFYGMSELFTQSQSAVIKPACHFAWIILTEVNAAFKLGLDDTLRDLRCLVLALPPGV